jgi:outer membrane receptor protein involved in Fe transport
MLEAGRASTFGGSVRGSVVGRGGSGTARYAFGVGSSYDRGPYRLPNDVRSNDGSLRVDLLPALASGAFSWTAITRFLGVDAHQPVRDLGATRAPLDSNQRQGRDRFLASLAGAWTPSARWTHRTTLSYYRRDFTYDDRFDNLDQSQFSTYVFDANFHYEAVVRRAIARYVASVGGQPTRNVRSSLSFGGEWQRESLRDDQSGDFGPASSSIARPSVSAFGEGQIRVRDRVSLLAGSRVEKFRGLDAAFVPRVTTVLDLVRDRVSLRGGISHAYKAPNIQDQFPSSPVFVTNPTLKPETSRSWELGTDLRASVLNATASVTYFHQNFENLIRAVGYDSTRQINRNLGKSRATGIEAEASVSPRERWTIGAEGAWTTTRVVDNVGLFSPDFPVGEELPFRPAYTASAYVGMPVTRRVSMILRTTGVGRQTALANRFSGPRVSIDPYNVLSATATWNASSRTDVYAQVDNLLDHTYDTAYDRTGIHRTVILGLRARP